ncbi:hypothetical protein GY45DRAFT_323991 [Cubamyces sp. BRFM 1775]|nr:hypothetical protein GY45DRAFT_323991 [Cubamyces sp. BRFM 1775]
MMGPELRAYPTRRSTYSLRHEPWARHRRGPENTRTRAASRGQQRPRSGGPFPILWTTFQVEFTHGLSLPTSHSRDTPSGRLVPGQLGRCSQHAPSCKGAHTNGVVGMGRGSIVGGSTKGSGTQ